MASIDCNLENNQVQSNPLHCRFKCDFCHIDPNTFLTEDNFNAHVLEHFVKKNCSICNKFLVRIGSQWYELHVDESKPQLHESDDNKNELELDSIAQIIVEKLEVELDCNDSNDYDISLDNDQASDALSTESNADPHGKREAGKRKTRRATSNIRKKCAKKAEPEKNKSTKPSQPRRKKGPLPRIKCRICDRIILKYNFESHLQKFHVPNVIVPKDPVKCQTCGKGFASAGSLKTHSLIHSGTKRFVCNYCGTSFRQLYHLTEHLNSHTGSKPYSCQICNKNFTRHGILKAHQLVHTGQKPHKCTEQNCDRAYAYEIDLKRHKFSVHGIYSKKHICSFCEKVFSERKLLRKHLESHSAGNIR